jgi:hypothetical protein
MEVILLINMTELLNQMFADYGKDIDRVHEVIREAVRKLKAENVSTFAMAYEFDAVAHFLATDFVDGCPTKVEDQAHGIVRQFQIRNSKRLV